MILSSTALMPFSMGSDPGVVLPSSCSLALWFLGYPDQALEKSHEALTLAQELSHPFSLAFALTLLPCSISSAGRGRQPKSRQRQLIALSTEQGFPFWLAIGNYPAGLGTGRAGTGRGRDCTDTPGSGCLAGYRGRG